MEAVSQGDGLVSLAGEEDSLLAIEESFEVILDEPFMTVNRIGTDFMGEVVLSGYEGLDRGRVQTVLDTAARHGQHLWARKHGDYGTILMYFSAKPPVLGGA